MAVVTVATVVTVVTVAAVVTVATVVTVVTVVTVASRVSRVSRVSVARICPAHLYAGQGRRRYRRSFAQGAAATPAQRTFSAPAPKCVGAAQRKLPLDR